MIATASQARTLLPCLTVTQSVSRSRCNPINSAFSGSISTSESWRSEFGFTLVLRKRAADRSSKPLRRRASAISAEAAGDGQTQASGTTAAAESALTYKHILLPILDRNPYLSEATKQVAATGASLARKFGAQVTVVVIDEDKEESITDHEVRMKNIRWHMAEGGFTDFALLERLGEGKKPAAVLGEVADDLGLDLVVMSMESIHHKHIDGNLLAEFVPCPILLLPL